MVEGDPHFPRLAGARPVYVTESVETGLKTVEKNPSGLIPTTPAAVSGLLSCKADNQAAAEHSTLQASLEFSEGKSEKLQTA